MNGLVPLFGGDFILLDVSLSMSDMANYRKRRIDVLGDVFADIRPEFPRCRVVTFGAALREIEPHARLPEPAGSTPLQLALSYVAPHQPARLAVLCDGEPDDPGTALEIAKSLNCFIATYYCGPEGNHRAIAFMRALAWSSADGIGRAQVIDLKAPQKLKGELRLLLDGPVP